MRTLSVLLLIAIIATIPAFSQTITVHRPNAADVWQTGETYDITWIKPGVTDPLVKITLWAPGQTTPAWVIASAAPNNGIFKWTIPHTIGTGKYRVKVKVKEKNIGDLSDIFTIKRVFKIVKNPPKVKGVINITAPTTGTDWVTGSTQQIKWKNTFTKNKSIKIDLYNYNGKKLERHLATTSSAIALPGDISAYNWTIPHDVFKWPGNYTIKISRVDGNAAGTSKMFHISRKTETKVYTVTVNTVNKCKWHEHDSRSSGMFGGGKKFVSPPGEYPDPGAGKMRVGYQNYYDSGEYHKHYIYRSFLGMNVDAYKGKGLLLKATLKYNFSNNLSSPAALGQSSIYVLNQVWNGTYEQLFTISADPHSNPTNITAIVQDWLLGKRTNYGLVMVGPNEQMQNNNDFCISISSPVTLELEFLEASK